MRIAIVRLTSLGDMIFCMASLQVIKRHIPDSEITWIADKKFADILDNNPDLTGVIKIGLKDLKKNFSVRNLMSEYDSIKQSGKFDIAIDLHGMIKSAVISRIAGKITAGFDRKTLKEPIAAMFYDKTFHVPPNLNWIYRYTSLAASALGFSFDEVELIEKKPYLFYKQEDALISKDYFKDNVKNIILVVASSWENKNYPKEKFVNVANALRQNILICHGSDHEQAIAGYIADNSPFVRVLPRMNLNQLKAAISRSDLLIGVDTGPAHIAWANNVPTITVLGPTPIHYIYSTARHKIIKSGSSVGNGEPRKDDFSVREIKETGIIEAAERLLA